MKFASVTQILVLIAVACVGLYLLDYYKNPQLWPSRSVVMAMSKAMICRSVAFQFSVSSMSCAPLVSISTVNPSSHNACMSGSELGCNSGSPPVNSIWFTPSALARSQSLSSPILQRPRFSNIRFESRAGSPG